MGRVHHLEGDGHEAEPVHGRADHRDFAGAGGRGEDGRRVSQARGQQRAARREAVAHLRVAYEVSERRACSALEADRTTVRYHSSRPDDAAVRSRLRDLASIRRRFGYRRLHVLLTREGIIINHKKLRRLYREERLQVRRRGGRKRALGTRAPMAMPQGPNQRWSLDFLSDAFADGDRRRLHARMSGGSYPIPRCLVCRLRGSLMLSLRRAVVPRCASPITAPS